MDASDALDFLYTMGGMAVEILTRTMPILSGIVDLVLGDETGNGLNASEKLREAIRCLPW